MIIKQIRNACQRIECGGSAFLIDPWLAGKGQMGCFADIPGHPYVLRDPVKEQVPMPIFDLPEPLENILSGVDAYIVTHLHPDHIDMAADGTVGAPLDKDVPVFVQDEADAAVLRRSGFRSVIVLTAEGVRFAGALLRKTPARHGTIRPCGAACGLILEAAGEPKLYIAGDTVWYEGVEAVLGRERPDIVTLNACAAETAENGRLIMNDEDVEAVSRHAPQARLIITHMDCVAHASITRAEMRGLLARRGVAGWSMPADGEALSF